MSRLCREATSVQDFDAVLVESVGATKQTESTTAEKVYVIYSFPLDSDGVANLVGMLRVVFDADLLIESCDFSTR